MADAALPALSRRATSPGPTFRVLAEIYELMRCTQRLAPRWPPLARAATYETPFCTLRDLRAVALVLVHGPGRKNGIRALEVYRSDALYRVEAGRALEGTPDPRGSLVFVDRRKWN